ncbi:MAG: YCF48-related protein [Rhodocyclaceae bacterium]|jgi:photosystem II stability/assembly factor-like uncharacterized protein|nr:YCF48-related protein [Rhodocyclaceae bacterium]
MKKLFLCLSSVFVLAGPWGPALAAFQDPLDVPALQGARPDRATLIQVIRTPGNRLVAVGRYGVVLLSDDAGQTWQQGRVPVSTDLVAASFPSARTGWAVGHGGIVLKTEDGGSAWTVQMDGRKAAVLLKSHYEQRLAAGDPEAQRGLEDALRFQEEGPGRPFLDVWFEDEASGYVVGAYNLILRTRDGGKSWTFLGDQVDNPGALHINAIQKIGDALFLAGEQGKLWRLDPATDKFALVPTPYAGSWFGLVGTSRAVVAFGLRGNVWRSGDGGASWQKIDSGVESTVTAGTRLDDGRIILATSGGATIVSSDEGMSFTPFKVERPMPFFGVAALAGKKGIALAGSRGVRINPAP